MHVAALRLLTTDEDGDKTLALHRYILGLALTALTCKPSSYLRQGCNLVSDPQKPMEFKLVFNDGRREDAALKHDEALAYAKEAAGAFGIGTGREVHFDSVLAKKDVIDAKKKTK